MADQERPRADAPTETAASNWTGGDPSKPETGFENGALIGRYVVLEHLGAGGMGTVYRAYDPRLERNVAIKLLRSGRQVGERATARMLREAKALAKLAHPNIVAVYDADSTDEHRVFIAMELVDGVTLREWLREEQPEQDRILAAFVDAARGLAAAHQADLVHRDFKPANAMVGADGRVRVLDFGLAFDNPPFEGGSEVALGLTRTGAVAGTPRYMAPEQHRGEEVTAAADQFALCVALYEALYGEHPFGGETVAELAAQSTAGTVRAPAAGSSVRPALRAVLLRGLAVEPAARYPSMAALVEALEAQRVRPGRRAPWLVAGAMAAVLAGGAVWVGRSQSIGTETGAAACSAVPGMLDEVWGPSQRAALIARAPTPGIGDAVAARLDAYGARWVAQRTAVCERRDESYDVRVQCLDSAKVGLDTVRGLLDEADPALFEAPEPLLGTLPSLGACEQPAGAMHWQVEPANDAAAAERQRVGQEMQRGFALRSAGKAAEATAVANAFVAGLEDMVDPVARANAARFAALYASDPDDAERLLRTSIASAIAARYEVGTVTAYADLVNTQIGHRRFEAASRSAELAEAHNQRLGRFVGTWPGMGKWSDLFGSRLANLRGLSAQMQSEHELAIEHFRRAAKLAEPHVEEHPDRIATALTNMAESMRQTGRYDEAVATYDKSLAVLDHRRDTNRGNIMITRQNRAAANIAAGHIPAAIEDSRLALELAAGTPNEGNIGYNLASLDVMVGDLDGAERELARTRKIWAATLPDGDPIFAVADVLACSIARERGDLERARGLCNSAESAITAAFGARHPFVASARTELAQTLIEQGETRPAITHLQGAIELYIATVGVDTTETATARAALGRALARTAPPRRDAALAALDESVASFERMKLPHHPGLVAPLLDLADLHLESGDRERASALIARVRAIGEQPGQTLVPRDRDRVAALEARLR